MFHLLVKYDGWAANNGSMSLDRVFEFTEDELTSRLKPDGVLDVGRAMKIPALFAQEGDEKVRLGSITSITKSTKAYSIDFALDDRIPPISNSTLQKLSPELGIEAWEFSRTHWAVKEANLFKALLLNQLEAPGSPKVFTLNKGDSVNDRLLSVMMPFDSRFDEVFAKIQITASSLNMTCLRADDIWEHDSIIQDIVSLVNRSRIVVCDCTGRNPNVFYETGIAHTLGRDVVLITQSEGDIPFDLRHIRYINYLNNGEGRDKLAEALAKRIKTLLD